MGARFGRGYLGRRAALARHKRYSHAVAVISQAYVDHRQRIGFRALLSLRFRKAQKIQAAWRGHVAYVKYQKDIKIVRAACVKMQKLGRGFMAYRKLLDLRDKREKFKLRTITKFQALATRPVLTSNACVTSRFCP